MHEGRRSALLRDGGERKPSHQHFANSVTDSRHPVDSVMALVTGISKDRHALTRTSPSSLGGLMLDRWMVLYSPEFSFTTMASAFMTCITCTEEGKKKIQQCRERERKKGQLVSNEFWHNVLAAGLTLWYLVIRQSRTNDIWYYWCPNSTN